MPLVKATHPLLRRQAIAAGLNRMPSAGELGPDKLTPYSLSPITLQADSGSFATINTALPLGTRAAIWIPQIDVKILSVSLATSMLNVTPDATMAIWITKFVANPQSISGSGIVFVEHVVQAGLAHSQRGGQDYVEETAPVVHHNEAIAVYVSNSGTGFASNRWSFSASIRYNEVL